MATECDWPGTSSPVSRELNQSPGPDFFGSSGPFHFPVPPVASSAAVALSVWKNTKTKNDSNADGRQKGDGPSEPVRHRSHKACDADGDGHHKQRDPSGSPSDASMKPPVSDDGAEQARFNDGSLDPRRRQGEQPRGQQYKWSRRQPRQKDSQESNGKADEACRQTQPFDWTGRHEN